jgi:hypothetical protein
LIVFQNGQISGALAELIRSTRAPTKDRLIGKIMGGNPVFRGTRVPVHMLAELVASRARARRCWRTGSVGRAPSAMVLEKPPFDRANSLLYVR